MALTPQEAEELRLLSEAESISEGLSEKETEELHLLEAAEAMQQEQPIEKSMGRSLARGARNVAAGLIDIPFTSMGEAVAQGIDSATNNYTAPQDDSEKTQETIQRSLASLPIGGAIGSGLKALKYAPKAIKSIGNFLKQSNVISPANVAGTMATAGLIQHHLNENPGDIVPALASGLVGGSVAQMGTQGLRNLATKSGRLGMSENLARKTGQALGINPNKVEDFSNVNITPTVADVSNKKSAKMITHALEHVPYSGESITNAKNLQREEVLKLLGQAEPTDILKKPEASKLTIKGAKAYQKAANKTHAEQFSKIKSDLKKMPDRNIDPKNVLKYLTERLTEHTSDPELIKDYLRSPEGKVLSGLEKVAKRHEGQIPYEMMKRTLSNINNKITTHGLIGKVDQGELKNVASLIDKDITNSMAPRFKELGKDSYTNWVNARENYHGYAEHDIPKLNELYKKNKKSAVDAFSDLITNQKQDAAKTKLVLKELPKDEQLDLMHAVQRKLGETSDGTFSILKWNRSFKTLGNDSQKILLAPLDKHNQKRVLEITNVIDHFRDTLKEANTSASGYYNTLSKIAANTIGAGTSIATGNLYPAAALAMTIALSKIGSTALTSPKLINWAYNGMRIKSVAQLERHLGNLGKINSIPKTIVREMQTMQHDLSKANDQGKT